MLALEMPASCSELVHMVIVTVISLNLLLYDQDAANTQAGEGFEWEAQQPSERGAYGLAQDDHYYSHEYQHSNQHGRARSGGTRERRTSLSSVADSDMQTLINGTFTEGSR